MNLRAIHLGVVLIALGGLAISALGQEAKPARKAKAAAVKREPKPAAKADPFGGAAAKPEGAAKSPFGEQRGKKAEGAKPAGKLDLSKLPVKTSPAVEAVLEAKPTTPAELAQAASTLSMLGRPDLSKQFLARLLEAKPDDAQMAALLERFSSGFFLEMTGQKELAPEAGKVAEAVFAGAARYRADPKRIAGLIGQLQDPSADARYKAMIALLDTGPAAIEPMLAVLADAHRSAEHANVRTVLAQFKSEALGPLMAALEAPDPGLVVQVIEVLAEMNARGAAVYLLAPLHSAASPAAVRQAAQDALVRLAGHAPDRIEAGELLLARAGEFYQHRQPPAAGINGKVDVWQWDPAKRRPEARSDAPEDADHATAVRLARQAYAIVPEDPLIRRLYAAALLEAAAYEAGLDNPLPDGPGTPVAQVALFDVKLLEEVLRWTMLDGHPAAATATARILGRKGTAEQLLYSGERPTPLVLASRHGDRRLRMAALEAIVRLRPQQGFAGSSFVPESLAYFAATTGSRRVLIAGTSAEKAMQASAGLTSAGYQIDVTPSGRETLQRALASPDYEFALIDVTIGEPTADLLLQYLRRDGRTADLPVGLVARDGYWARTEQLARRTPLATAFWRGHDPKAIQWQAGQLGALAGRDFTPFAIRQAQALHAMELLAELAHGESRCYDLRRIQPAALAALTNPALVLAAIGVVEALGTPESQRSLVDLASVSGTPIKVRLAAAAAFNNSTRRGGILLTTGEILRQYERYNQSEKLDRPTQLVLGNLLDSIEAPSKRLSALKTPGDILPAPQPAPAAGGDPQSAAPPAPLPAGEAAPIPPAERGPGKK